MEFLEEKVTVTLWSLVILTKDIVIQYDEYLIFPTNNKDTLIQAGLLLCSWGLPALKPNNPRITQNCPQREKKGLRRWRYCSPGGAQCLKMRDGRKCWWIPKLACRGKSLKALFCNAHWPGGLTLILWNLWRMQDKGHNEEAQVRYAMLPRKNRPFWDLRVKPSWVRGHNGHSGDRTTCSAKSTKGKLDLFHRSV